MEFVYFTVAGLLLYFLSDWLLGRIEAWRGAAFKQRNLVFFAIILVLALTSFKAIELITGA